MGVVVEMRILTEEVTKFQSKNVIGKKDLKCIEGVEKELLFRFKLKDAKNTSCVMMILTI